MEIDITYKAKDGMEFSDPYLCEQYEKNLDKAPGTVGYFLGRLDQFKETDFFTGTIIYKEKDQPASFYTRTNIDFSDLYEGEIVTQAMKEAQMRVTNTIADVRRHFEKIDLSTPCGGTCIISKDHGISSGALITLSCNPVYKAINEQK